MKLVSTTLQGVEEFLATGDNGLGAVDIVTGDEEASDEAEQEADEEDDDHGEGRTSTLTSGPRLAGVCGASNP